MMATKTELLKYSGNSAKEMIDVRRAHLVKLAVYWYNLLESVTLTVLGEMPEQMGTGVVWKQLELAQRQCYATINKVLGLERAEPPTQQELQETESLFTSMVSKSAFLTQLCAKVGVDWWPTMHPVKLKLFELPSYHLDATEIWVYPDGTVSKQFDDAKDKELQYWYYPAERLKTAAKLTKPLVIPPEILQSMALEREFLSQLPPQKWSWVARWERERGTQSQERD